MPPLAIKRDLEKELLVFPGILSGTKKGGGEVAGIVLLAPHNSSSCHDPLPGQGAAVATGDRRKDNCFSARLNERP